MSSSEKRFTLLRRAIRLLDVVPVVVVTSMDDRGRACWEPKRIYVNPVHHETLQDLAHTLVHELVHMCLPNVGEATVDVLSERLLTSSRTLQMRVYMVLAQALMRFIKKSE